MNISVAMATYNGEKFIKQELDTIISDIAAEDEIIISDDGSSDKTIEIIAEYASKYPNIKYFINPSKGVFTNFENAIMHCSNDIICLSDQDDIWISGKREKLIQIFKEKQVSLVMHNATMFNEEGEFAKSYVHKRNGVVMNIFKNCYWGCCMAFKKSFIEKYLPFGFAGVAHDQLIGLLSEREHSNYFLDEVLIKHRIHGKNVSAPQKVLKKIIFRIKLARDYFAAVKKEGKLQ